MISYALGHFIFLAWFWVATLNRQTRQRHTNQNLLTTQNAMKKNISKIALKTDKIVSLSAKQAQQIVGGGGLLIERYPTRKC